MTQRLTSGGKAINLIQTFLITSKWQTKATVLNWLQGFIAFYDDKTKIMAMTLRNKAFPLAKWGTVQRRK